MDDTEHHPQHMNRLEGSPAQELPMRDMDVMHPAMTGPPFGFNVQNNQHVFDRNIINAYKQNMGAPLGFNPIPNQYHMDMMNRQKHDGYGSEDDEFGQGLGKRKLDDAMQRQQHSNREKKRRNEMNEAIESLKLLLPQSDKNRFRVTKVSVLNEAIEYVQRIKELCMILAKDKRELHDDNTRLYQQLAALGKDVGEPRRYDDRNLMETLQSAITLPNRDPSFSPNGRLDFQNEFPGMRFDGQQGFPFGHPGMLPVPFGHPGMPMMGPQMRLPNGRPAPPGMPIEFNPMNFPFPFPPGGKFEGGIPDFRQFPGGEFDPQFFQGMQNPNFPDGQPEHLQEHQLQEHQLQEHHQHEHLQEHHHEHLQDHHQQHQQDPNLVHESQHLNHHQHIDHHQQHPENQQHEPSHLDTLSNHGSDGLPSIPEPSLHNQEEIS